MRKNEGNLIPKEQVNTNPGCWQIFQVTRTVFRLTLESPVLSRWGVRTPKGQVRERAKLSGSRQRAWEIVISYAFFVALGRNDC
jgi:hypothetical protein